MDFIFSISNFILFKYQINICKIDFEIILIVSCVCFDHNIYSGIRLLFLSIVLCTELKSTRLLGKNKKEN